MNSSAVMRAPIPVTILTGFLGAGKTTLLNNILHGNHGLKVAVLVNDFGAVNIDAQLVVGIEGETINLANGCICCTIRDDLLKAAVAVTERPDPPEYMIVETSGVSDPLSVAQTFMHPALDGLLEVDSIVTVVDADQLPTLKGESAMLALSQMTVADMILVNKIDLVTPAQLAALKKDWLFPQARAVETTFANVPLELILGVGRYDPAQLLNAVSHDVHVHGEDETHTHEHADHSLVFSAWSWTSAEPLSFKALKAAVRTLPPTIFRLKGFVNLADSPAQRGILHVVGTRVRMTLGDPWADVPPHSQLVAIGAQGGVDAEALNRRFEDCIAGRGTRNPLARALGSVVEWVRKED